MKPSAIEQCNQRLERGLVAIDALKAAKDYPAAEAAWTDFLLAAATIYSKLEQGAKGCSKSEPWYGQRKRARKTDQLLKYLHFARNSDEHGIEFVTRRGPANRTPDGRELAFGEVFHLNVRRAAADGQGEGEWIEAAIIGPNIVPVRACDSRYGDYCDPPTTHLGNDLGIKTPAELAELGQAYLAEMVAEASLLPEH